MDRQYLQEYFANCADVQILETSQGMIILYVSGLANIERIYELIISNSLERLPAKSVKYIMEIETAIFNGELIVVDPKQGVIQSFITSNSPQRKPEEAVTETTIKGARDGFTESIETNIALIRKRIRTSTFKCEMFKIGKRFQTKVALLYFEDVANAELIEEARHRLSNIELDVVIGNTTIEEALSDKTHSLAPIIDTTGRPDYAAECLNAGRFFVLIDGSSIGIIAPTSLISLIRSPEDAYFTAPIVNMQRVLRICGGLLSIFLPGLLIALTTYHFEQIPMPLLATLTANRMGLPLSLPLEGFLALVLFELFKEAGIKLPKTVGPTVTVVGGLILSTATIEAGLTSPTVMLAMAVSVISGYTLINTTISSVVPIIRMVVFILSSLLGMFGFFISGYLIVALLASLQSFGVPYLSPISPPIKSDILKGVFKPFTINNPTRPKNLQTQDETKRPEDST